MLVSHVARSQDASEDVPKPCDPIRCYGPGRIPLTLDDGTEAAFELAETVPIVVDDAVRMFPGATVFVGGELIEGRLANVRVVAEPSELVSVLEIRMWQEPLMADTFLAVTNYFHEVAKYSIHMLLPRAENYQPTSACAVLGDGRVGYEHWSYSILQLVLVDFTFIGADRADLPCE